jgi:hypothetical protein
MTKLCLFVTNGSLLTVAMTVPAGLRTLSSSLALFFLADGSPIIARDLTHGSAKYFRLARALNIPVQGRVSHLCFSVQRIETPAERIVARELTFSGNPVQLLVKKVGRLQPDRPPRVIHSLIAVWLRC